MCKNGISEVETSVEAPPMSTCSLPLPPGVDGGGQLQTSSIRFTLPQSSADLYRHYALPDANRYIRVLILDALEPGSGSDAPVTGSLCIRAWAENPCFSALSYVWGKQDDSKFDTLTIRLGHTGCISLRVSPNCYQALTALRRHFGGIHIWVDAICINQADDDEKSKQINLMGDVYTWAQTVYVWLGPGNEATNKGMDWLSYAARFTIFRELVEVSSAIKEADRAAARRKLWHKLILALWRRFLERYSLVTLIRLIGHSIISLLTLSRSSGKPKT
jgi:hypothetical protein